MRKKILIVDDSSTALMMEQMILSKEPYKIVTAANGRDAVAKALAERPDLILMDVVMPEMNGFEACEELRRQEVTKATPIIIVTTRGEGENVETGFRSGCSDYITKPVNRLELLTKLRSYLEA